MKWQFLPGYLNNPEATGQMVDTDRWEHKGDTKHYDENGHFFIVDRLKELVKYNAFQIANFLPSCDLALGLTP